MHFWLTLFHIGCMAIWFAGLFLLPRLLTDAQRDGMGQTLYFGLMTPAAVATIVMGIALLAQGFHGAWLPAKLGLVAVAVGLHVYLGTLLVASTRGAVSRSRLFFEALSWAPLLLMLAIVALAAAKPIALPPLGGV